MCIRDRVSTQSTGNHKLAMCDHSHDGEHGHSHCAGGPDSGAEALIKGSNLGTKWLWSYEGGEFEVEFGANGEFFCHDYPRHSHWTLEGKNLTIEWEDLGTYDMVVDVCCKKMEGSYRGYPEDWRRATLAGELDHVHSHDDAHGHSHDGVQCSGHH
eukprot:TRINITY_DN446_c0_g1_i3.p1 TRINITY_DN446_c0_g1~~TRINITY_DN446_c0_g1_i3.p1  ORF type:complete len:156 (-),score=25.74 TRINITY_DN446_c0_g1_i3:276-743(-)